MRSRTDGRPAATTDNPPEKLTPISPMRGAPKTSGCATIQLATSSIGIGDACRQLVLRQVVDFGRHHHDACGGELVREAHQTGLIDADRVHAADQ